jgi:3-oxoadipate enol-lactonase
MGGEEDKVGGPRQVMLSIAERIPNAIYTPVPGAAHIANLQNPEGFNQILKSFLLSVANRT